jgi:hypothetical protein
LPMPVGDAVATGESVMVAVVVAPGEGVAVVLGRVAVAVTPGEGVTLGVFVGLTVGLGVNVAVGLGVNVAVGLGVGDGMAVLVTVGVGLCFTLREDGVLSALAAWELILTSINDRRSSIRQSIAAMIFAKKPSL